MKKILLSIALFGVTSLSFAQVTAFNQDFEGFATGTQASWPQENWSRVQSAAGPWIYASGTTNKYIQYYSMFTTNTPGYLISPEITANGQQTLTFVAQKTTGSAANGTLEVGFVNSSTDVSVFTQIGETINLNDTSTPYSLSVPASSQKYIAFKLTGSAEHTALQLDDIVLTDSGLGVISSNNQKNISHALTADGNTLKFVSTSPVKTVQIYDASGKLVKSSTVVANETNVANLKSGVYFIVAETLNGKTLKSNFVKR